MSPTQLAQTGTDLDSQLDAYSATLASVGEPPRATSYDQPSTEDPVEWMAHLAVRAKLATL